MKSGKETQIILFDHFALVIFTFKGTLRKMTVKLFIIGKNLKPIINTYPKIEELRVNSNMCY